MATITACDGCHALITGESHKVGHVQVCDYCDDCAVTAKAMLAEFDAVHDKIQNMWVKQLYNIRKSYEGKLKKLPDESDDV